MFMGSFRCQLVSQHSIVCLLIFSVFPPDLVVMPVAYKLFCTCGGCIDVLYPMLIEQFYRVFYFKFLWEKLDNVAV